MGLSSNLISQFVKATSDNKKSKSETITYGTIVMVEGSPYVRLDGAGEDTLTPVSNTTNVANGERVTVMIKNHTATVTGNITSPSARLITHEDGTKTVEGLENISTETINIKGRLTAAEGKIETLEADDVTIKNRLTATEADIETLTTVKLDASVASITYATIANLDASNAKIYNLESTYGEFVKLTTDDLTAVKGRISSLESGVAEIDTLIFGSATGTTIQTSFANAVIAQLGDAQIKSAMIESVSAGKITSGDIITNNVRVLSEDGRLILSDETLQISDANRVRVQIGKDASNDYSINIWDDAGNLMFSKGGITDSAIKEAIIRNDMVSETANISASKLDIDSLFSEINGSSNTIKSTKVYLDEEKQTLDVAFKSLETEVTEQGETITSQGTAISTIQGQITSKIWQQDIDTAKNEMSTQYSTLEQDLNGFKTTVGETYATTDELKTISVGGTNIMLNSKEGYPFSGQSFHNSTHTGTKITCTVEGAPADHYRMITNFLSISPNELSKEVGTEITFSADVKIVGSIANPRMTFDLRSPGSQTKIAYMCAYADPSITDRWQRIHATVVIPTTTVNIDNSLIAMLYDSATLGSSIEYRKVKLERGNKDTDWTPAPEDMESDITELSTKYSSIEQTVNSISSTVTSHTSKINDAESSITQLSNTISANVVETTNLGTRMTTVEQTSEDLTVELKKLEIGGRNYASLVDLQRYSGGNLIEALPCWTIEGSKIIATGQPLSNPLPGFKIRTDGGYTYTISGYTNLSALKTYHKCFDADGATTQAQIGNIVYPSNGYFKLCIDIPNTTMYFNIGVGSDAVSDYYIDRLKIERGNRATDWSPAPEDVDSDVRAAAKTATDYLNFSVDGLVIGDLTSDTLGKNVLIDSDSVNIRNETTVLASFEADCLYLAKHSRDAKIDLCNGLAKMYHEIDSKGYSLFNIDTTYALSYIKMSAPMHDLLVLENTATTNGVIIKGMIHGTTVGGFGLVRDGYMVRYGSDVDEDNPVEHVVLDTGNFLTEMDDGWHYTGGYAENFTQYNNETHSQVRYRKVGGVVEVRGALKATATIEGSDTKHTMFTLPEGYRPDCRIVQRCQGSGLHTWMLTVETSGAVTFSRYGVGTSYSNISTSVWLPIQITFLIN